MVMPCEAATESSACLPGEPCLKLCGRAGESPPTVLTCAEKACPKSLRLGAANIMSPLCCRPLCASCASRARACASGPGVGGEARVEGEDGEDGAVESLAGAEDDEAPRATTTTGTTGVVWVSRGVCVRGVDWAGYETGAGFATTVVVVSVVVSAGGGSVAAWAANFGMGRPPAAGVAAPEEPPKGNVGVDGPEPVAPLPVAAAIAFAVSSPLAPRGTVRLGPVIRTMRGVMDLGVMATGVAMPEVVGSVVRYMAAAGEGLGDGLGDSAPVGNRAAAAVGAAALQEVRGESCEGATSAQAGRDESCEATGAVCMRTTAVVWGGSTRGRDKAVGDWAVMTTASGGDTDRVYRGSSTVVAPRPQGGAAPRAGAESNGAAPKAGPVPQESQDGFIGLGAATSQPPLSLVPAPVLP
mmetsp:Transcript_75695/g.245236  ORF Transcript_75695/g.245236 Transcript_75695/m.245236 type:complete len:412 (+) Transcript_75695:1261-2496(+)